MKVFERAIIKKKLKKRTFSKKKKENLFFKI